MSRNLRRLEWVSTDSNRGFELAKYAGGCFCCFVQLSFEFQNKVLIQSVCLLRFSFFAIRRSHSTTLPTSALCSFLFLTGLWGWGLWCPHPDFCPRWSSSVSSFRWVSRQSRSLCLCHLQGLMTYMLYCFMWFRFCADGYSKFQKTSSRQKKEERLLAYLRVQGDVNLF